MARSVDDWHLPEGDDPNEWITRGEAYALVRRNGGLLKDLRRMVRRLGLLLGAGLLLLLALTYFADRKACERSVPLRSGLNQAAVYFDGQSARALARAAHERTSALAAIDVQAANAASATASQLDAGQLDCARVIP